jgi:hypothetical protein
MKGHRISDSFPTNFVSPTHASSHDQERSTIIDQLDHMQPASERPMQDPAFRSIKLHSYMNPSILKLIAFEVLSSKPHRPAPIGKSVHDTTLQ